MNLDHSKAYRQIDLFGGEGEVLVWDLLNQTQKGPFEAVLACELAPGASVGAHRQEHADEIVVVTAGSGTAHVDGSALTLKAGAVVWLALGSFLKLENGSEEEPLQYLIVKAARATAD